MLEMAANSVQEQWSAILDQLEINHEEVLITRRGKPVAKLVPVEEGSILMRGDIGSIIGDGPDDLSMTAPYSRKRRHPGSAKGKLIIVAEDESHLDDFAEYMS